MPTFRSFVPVAIAAALALVVAAAAALPAGSAVRAVPVAKLTARISPHGRSLPPHTPVALALDTRFASAPSGGKFVLRRADYRLPRGTVVNGRLFPSCSVRTLRRAHGRLRACPQGSRIGRGTVLGDVVDIGITSRGRLTLFNGPGGRSVTIDVSIKTPALIDTAVSARVRRLAGRGADQLTFVLPADLRTILDSDIVTSRVHLKLGATRVVHGIRRGYVELEHCPRSGRTRLDGRFRFERGARTNAEARVAC